MSIEAGTVKGWAEYANEEWAGIMNGGQGEQEVTGIVHLPQGGTRESDAAVKGGTYFDAEEPATGIFDELETLNKDIFQGQVSDAISGGDLTTANERIQECELFMTNLGKSRLAVYLGECENEDEIAATEQVIDSYKFHIESNISFDWLREEVVNMVRSSLGGGS